MLAEAELRQLTTSHSTIGIYTYPNLREVPAEPDSGEVTPAQLANDMVLAVEQVTDLNGVIATCTHDDTGI